MQKYEGKFSKFIYIYKILLGFWLFKLSTHINFN